MANKKVNQLTSKPAVNLTDLFLIADPTSGQAFKTTISDLGTAIGSGVSSVNSLVGAVVLDTDDIQELVSPTNKWFTDTRARAAISAGTGISYNSGTGVITNAVTSGQIATALGYTPANGANYLPLTGGNLTGALGGTSATFSLAINITATSPKIYLNSNNNSDYYIANDSGTFKIYDTSNYENRFTIGATGNGTFGGNLTVGQIIRSGGTSAQFLKADGSVDSTAYLPLAGGTLTGALNGTSANFSSYLNAQTIDISNTTASNALLITQTNTGYHAVSINNAGGSALYANGSVSFIGTLSVTGVITAQSGLANGAGQSFALPSTTGTLALTSDLYSYLPLTGGTLTGALSGTSASFSNTITNSLDGDSARGLYFTANRPSGINWYNIADVEQYSIGVIGDNGDGYWGVWSSTSSTAIDRSIAIPKFKIENNGAATFSNDVTIGRATASTNVKLIFNGVASKAAGIEFQQSGSAQWYLGNGIASEDNNFELYNSNGTMAMKIIKSTNAINFQGAATFSSSVTAGGNIVSSVGTTNTSLFLQRTGNTFECVVQDNQSRIRTFGTSGNDKDLLFDTDNAGTTRLFIKGSNGNVGIGTTSPTKKLSIYEGTSTTLHTIKMGSPTSTTNGYLGMWYGQLRITNGSTYDTTNGWVADGASAPAQIYLNSGNGSSFITFDTASSNVAEPTERMRITSGGKVGIGTDAPDGKLHVESTFTELFVKSTVSGNNAITKYVNDRTWGAGINMALGDSSFEIYDYTASKNRLVITPSGNIGIGTTDPQAILNGFSSSAKGLVIENSFPVLAFSDTASSLYKFYVGTDTAEAYVWNSANGPIVFGTNNNPVMRITSGGNVRINTSSDINSRGNNLLVSGAETMQLYGYGNAYGIGLFMCPNSSATGTHKAVSFRSPANGEVGSIQTTDSLTLYNTTSDYRLKEDLKPIKGLEIVNKIKVYDYKWKAEDIRMDGVLAHELQEILPYAVSGLKDGNEMQGVDYSKIVPVMVQAIKDLKAELDTLKNK